MNTTSPLRVLAVSADARPTTGWGAFTYHVCEALQRKPGVEVTLLLPPEARLPDARPEFRVEHILPPWTASFRRRPDRIAPFLFPNKLGFPTDLVHALVDFPYGITAIRLARRLNVPAAISGQGTYTVAPLRRIPDRWVFGWALRRAAFITVPSSYTADLVQARTGTPLPLQILPNGVDVSRYEASPLSGPEVRRRFGIPTEARLVLSVGALKARKGMDVLVRAFSLVRRREPNAYLVIAGSGNSQALLQTIRQHDLEDAVRIPGEIDADELVGLYHEADVFALLPRRHGDHFEGFGLVYLEAGAAGTPVVGARSGGVPSAVLEGETGLLVEEEDFEGAASAILELLGNRELSRRLGENGRRWAQRNDWASYADRLLALYRSAIRGGTSSQQTEQAQP